LSIEELRQMLAEYLDRTPEAHQDGVLVVIESDPDRKPYEIMDLDFGYRPEMPHPVLVITVS